MLIVEGSLVPRDTTSAKRQTYLVVDRNFLATADLESAILAVGERRQVMTYSALNGAREGLDGIAQVDAAFFGVSPGELEGDPIVEMIERRGGLVVLVGEPEAAEPARASGWAFLARPIDPARVRSLLKER